MYDDPYLRLQILYFFQEEQRGKNWERERSERAASLKKVFSRRFLEEASDAEFEEALREVFPRYGPWTCG